MCRSIIKKVILLVCFFAVGIGFISMTTNVVHAQGGDFKSNEKNEIDNVNMVMFSSIEEIKESKEKRFKDIKLTDEQMKLLRSEVNLFEKELYKMDIDIVAELRKKIADFQNMLESANSTKEYNQIQNMLSLTQYILYEYETYLNNQIACVNDAGVQSRGIEDIGYNPIYAPVLAVLVYFSAQGWSLAYELLLHMATNTEFNSIYKPYYGYLVNNSEIFQNIVL